MVPSSLTCLNEFSTNHENASYVTDDSDSNESDPSTILKDLKIRNINRLIIGHLNINSIHRKFGALKQIVQDNIDILVISETKLNETYPKNSYDIEGYAMPFRRDRYGNGLANAGGVLIYVKEDIPCRELKVKSDYVHLEGIFLEINLRKTKWLVFGGYNNHKSNINNFLENIGDILDHHICKLENLLLLGDFNCEITENPLKIFCDTYNLQNLVTEPTCYKNPLNPSSIDLILTNHSRLFHNTIVLETGLSDHHKMTVTVLKIFVTKQRPILVKYRDYRKFNSQTFRHDLQYELSTIAENICYDRFENTFKENLDKHAPIKTKIMRANNAPFMNKKLSKAIMNRSRLKNKFHKNPNSVNETKYKQQRNYCVNLTRKVKKDYYTNLDIKKVNDNKTFWSTLKPCFSDKSISKKKITLIENGTIISKDAEVAATMNTFFSESVNKNGNTGYNASNSLDINQIIDKFINHPSIIKIREKSSIESKFSFKLSTLSWSFFIFFVLMI